MAHLLIVEDDADCRRLLIGAVRRLGHTAEAHAAASAALDALAAASFDGLMIDVELPGMDGFGLVREARGRDLSTAPVLIASVTDREDLPADLEVAAWLSKPFAREELAGAVRRLLAGP